jgi:RND family efflux transporter MFP subunit
MKKKLPVTLAVLVIASCGSRAPQPSAGAEQELHTESITHWTEKTELFVEFAPLVVGRTSRFAIHLTRLDNFKPVATGHVEVRLRHGNGHVETFSVNDPSRPGIFGIDVQPSELGEIRVTVVLAAPALSDIHEIGTQTVFDSAGETLQEDSPTEEETIAFLKEQQWLLDFATEVVQNRTLREGIRVPAEVTPRSGGKAEVNIPFNGRLIADTLPAPGAAVAIGEMLAQVLPPTGFPSDLPSLELAKAEAEAALRLARQDRQRAERLVEAGAAPAKRLDEARTAETTAEARLGAAEARLAQYEATRSAEGNPSNARLFALRAPISGVITETYVSPGANVRAGETVFRIVDVETVYVSGKVPEVEISKLRRLTGAELEVPGADQVLRVGRRISIGRVVDPDDRTVSVIYEVSNRDHHLAVGQAVFLRLFTSAGRVCPAIPESAAVDDGGRPVVFLQWEGEAFVRRPVKLGSSENGYVQVVEGLQAGDRVVSRGAYLIRLAALSNQIPAHGHVH